MEQLDDFLKNIDHSKQAPLPAGFEQRVLDKWFNEVSKKKQDYTVLAYAAAACLIAFSCINILSLLVLNQSENELSTHIDTDTTITISSEAEFAEAYGLVQTTSYYTLNK
jgi:hypothetical protein